MNPNLFDIARIGRVASGGTGPIQPLPMQISDAERFRPGLSGGPSRTLALPSAISQGYRVEDMAFSLEQVYWETKPMSKELSSKKFRYSFYFVLFILFH